MQSLQNHLLIAMPGMDDPFFKRTVTYICEHDENGAMGLIINQPIGLKADDLLRQMKLQDGDFVLPEAANPEILVGGPVATERGFVLHSRDPDQIQFSSSLALSDQLMITTSRDVLESIGGNTCPKDYIIALGYAGWQKGQLEEELAQNSWLTIPAEVDILFDIPLDNRWAEATKRLGIDPAQLSTQAGHS
ncbi:YqgE/AlgH family protein [Paraferrimonas sedimenticola]|uniref:UPF0301 protein GCM10007895_24280 n=1 Tax=Paraferrimonas sedimenticola TaxID=375674 RepID=A0AA37W209_9GAMM|nr:YqgE/AlgH family protein [Paraferrimonas sedimenticola]GLP97122.1 UPF0301 protein [Paraferrimonas sedimenticola]